MRLADYLARIGLDATATAAGETPFARLSRLHLAHRETFLFENLTIQTGGAISVRVTDLERKFLDERRGGYCFEHNTLFAAALVDAGFSPITLLGRVRRGPPERWCRTHMVLRVPNPEPKNPEPGTPNTEPEAWLADVGFGGLGLLWPIPLGDGTSSLQGGIEYTLRRDGHLWVLSMRDASGDATDLYEFSDDPQTPWDVEVANHFTSTHPESVFRRTLTIQRSSRDERVILRSGVLTRYRGGRMTEQPIDRAQLPRLARELFGVELPDGPLVFDTFGAAVASS